MAQIRIAIMQQGAFTAGQWTAITNNSLALRDLTDAQVTRLQATYPGTPSQTAAAVMAEIVKHLRGQARHSGGAAQRATDEAALNTNQANFETAFAGEWPDG